MPELLVIFTAAKGITVCTVTALSSEYLLGGILIFRDLLDAFGHSFSHIYYLGIILLNSGWIFFSL